MLVVAVVMTAMMAVVMVMSASVQHMMSVSLPRASKQPNMTWWRLAKPSQAKGREGKQHDDGELISEPGTIHRRGGAPTKLGVYPSSKSSNTGIKAPLPLAPD